MSDGRQKRGVVHMVTTKQLGTFAASTNREGLLVALADNDRWGRFLQSYIYYYKSAATFTINHYQLSSLFVV
jgi:hypothetical protein